MILAKDYILVKEISEEQNGGGLVLTKQKNNEQFATGEVKFSFDSFGEHSITGRSIMFERCNSKEINVKGEDYLLVKFADVIIIL